MTRNSVAQLIVSEEVRCPTSPKMLFHVSERACLVSGDRKGISVGFEMMMNATSITTHLTIVLGLVILGILGLTGCFRKSWYQQ